MSQQDVCICVEKCIGFGFPISSAMRNSGFPVVGSMGNLKVCCLSHRVAGHRSRHNVNSRCTLSNERAEANAHCQILHSLQLTFLDVG
jgi:hypothetical protein